MRAKQIGNKVDRNPAKHMSKPRNHMPKMRKLIAMGRLVPVYNFTEEKVFLAGYRRKASSRKSHQMPFMLNEPIPLATLPLNPES